MILVLSPLASLFSLFELNKKHVQRIKEVDFTILQRFYLEADDVSSQVLSPQHIQERLEHLFKRRVDS